MQKCCHRDGKRFVPPFSAQSMFLCYSRKCWMVKDRTIILEVCSCQYFCFDGPYFPGCLVPD